ncbi:MAG: protease inhibitor I42 family protein [Methanobacteriota archaeon]
MIMGKAKNELRRKVTGFAIYAAVSTILVVALANLAVGAARSEQTNFGPADNGKIVELVAGTIITVELLENPSTGYAWYYSINGKVAEVMEDSFILSENPILGLAARAYCN